MEINFNLIQSNLYSIDFSNIKIIEVNSHKKTKNFLRISIIQIILKNHYLIKIILKLTEIELLIKIINSIFIRIKFIKPQLIY